MLNVYYAHLLDAPSFGKLRSVPDGALVLDDKTGTLSDVGTSGEIATRHPHLTPFTFPENTRPVITPGLIDIHAHLPQYPAVARTEDGLLPWLNRHIFPLERDFRGEESLPIIEAFFAELAASGTTAAMLYGAVWKDTCDLAFAAAERAGLRIVLGKVMMDVGTYGDLPPEPARDLSLRESAGLLERWHGANRGLLRYAVSPRFAVTCSAELMREAAALAEKHGAFVQTHLSENHGEIETVARLFPGAKDYTDVYDRAGLLSPRSVLGHCIHLSDREIDTLAERGAAVAHCPTSNLFLNSGLCPLDKLRAAGLRIALGSDVAGGPELNLWQVMRSAVESQKARRFTAPDVPELTPAGAFHLATKGGADVLDQSDTLGLLEPGREADLAIWDLNKVLPYAGKFTSSDPFDAHSLAAQLVYRGSPSALLGAFVRGNPVTDLPLRDN